MTASKPPEPPRNARRLGGFFAKRRSVVSEAFVYGIGISCLSYRTAYKADVVCIGRRAAIALAHRFVIRLGVGKAVIHIVGAEKELNIRKAVVTIRIIGIGIAEAVAEGICHGRQKNTLYPTLLGVFFACGRELIVAELYRDVIV